MVEYAYNDEEFASSQGGLTSYERLHQLSGKKQEYFYELRKMLNHELEIQE